MNHGNPLFPTIYGYVDECPGTKINRIVKYFIFMDM